MMSLLFNKEQSVIREAACGIANLLQSPDDMMIWLKFDSTRLSIDASSNYVLITHGEPKNLSSEKVNKLIHNRKYKIIFYLIILSIQIYLKF